MRKSVRIPFFITVSFFCFSSSYAQVWKDVAPVFYDNCTTCHRPGEIAPFSMMTYSDLANCIYLTSIPSYVNSGLMPPWKADPNYRHFLDERILTQDEKDLITNWVNAGIPAGDTTQAPQPPIYPSGSQIGIPDLVLTMLQPHTIQGNSLDDYECFVLPTNLVEGQNISAIEFRPGNAAAVHHAFMYLVTDSSAVQLDEQTPEYGYPSFGGAGQGVDASVVGLYVPGLVPRFFPADGVVSFPAKSFLVIQVHYAPLTYSTTDQSSVNLFFSNYTDPRPVGTIRIGEDYITNPPFAIEANTIDTFYSEFTIPDYDRSLFAIVPHQHLLGKSYKIFGVTPENDTLPLVYIPQWDFHWQMLYSYPYLVHLEEGTIIHAIAVYDNTTNNANNPNNPPVNVTYGESSTDEMFKYFIKVLHYEPGDEDIVIDTTYYTALNPPADGIVSTPQLYSCYPNPSMDNIVIPFYLPPGMDASVTISDVIGRQMDHRNISSSGNLQKFDLNVNEYDQGEYFVTLHSSVKTVTKSFVVQR